jgi:hypothetical protein
MQLARCAILVDHASMLSCAASALRISCRPRFYVVITSYVLANVWSGSPNAEADLVNQEAVWSVFGVGKRKGNEKEKTNHFCQEQTTCDESVMTDDTQHSRFSLIFLEGGWFCFYLHRLIGERGSPSKVLQKHGSCRQQSVVHRLAWILWPYSLHLVSP